MENYLQQVKQAKKGDPEAFAVLYESVYQDMYRFALYTLKNPEDAKDAVSDTVTDAFASIRKLRTEEAFRGWIFRILSNKCKKKLKEYSNQTMELTEDTLNRSVGKDEAENAVLRSLFFELSQEERLIIAMHMFGGYSSKEMSVILHMNENTLRSKESRAIRRLSAEIAD